MIENAVLKPDTSELESRKNLPEMPDFTFATHHYSTAHRQPWRLRLQISGEQHTTVGMEVKGRILIGRKDTRQTLQPDLDLTPYGAATLGVSRHHVVIVRDEDGLYIEDLKSTNRTCLNGLALKQAPIRYKLRDGDELTLGQMKVVVRFVKSPFRS